MVTELYVAGGGEGDVFYSKYVIDQINSRYPEKCSKLLKRTLDTNYKSLEVKHTKMHRSKVSEIGHIFLAPKANIAKIKH